MALEIVDALVRSGAFDAAALDINLATNANAPVGRIGRASSQSTFKLVGR
jgi:hypothetical protein